MSIQFDEIGQTIAIGAFFLISIGILLGNAGSVKELLAKGESVNLPPLFVTAVLLAFLYSIGILAQSVAKNTIADRPPNVRGHLSNILLPSDEGMRYDAYKYFIEKKTVFDSIALKGTLDLILKDSTILYDMEPDTSKINSLFFYCKNTLFNNGKHYLELKGIENKMTFSASLVLISWFSLILYSFVMFLRTIKDIFGSNKSDRQKGSFWKKFRIQVYYMVVLSLLLISGCLSYRSQQDNYNLRIFGYYCAGYEKPRANASKGEYNSNPDDHPTSPANGIDNNSN